MFGHSASLILLFFLNIKYFYICVADSPHQNIIKYISKCNDFIHEARLSGGNVLVHCLAGMSRSVAIVAGYLMTITNFSCNDSLDAIRSARSISAPNPGFYKQLLDFEIYCLRQECERMKLQYREKYFELKQNDENELRHLLTR